MTEGLNLSLAVAILDANLKGPTATFDEMGLSAVRSAWLTVRATLPVAPPTQACVNHFNRPSRVNLDGDDLCQECADTWVRGEGQHAAWLEAQEAEAAGPRSFGVPQDEPANSLSPLPRLGDGKP